MKKKVTILLVLVLALSVLVGTLVGCNSIITLNEERDANQVVATVSYAGQTSEIYKYELAMSFNSYAYIYHAYYDMTYQEAADYILQSLAQRELLVLFAKDELVSLRNEREGRNDSPAGVSVADLLSGSELDRAIDNVNDDIVSAINTALGTLISANNPSSSTGGSSAEYEEYNGADAITIRFDSRGGSTVDRERIQNGTAIFEPAEPTYDGYTFYGWSTEPISVDEDIDTSLIWDFDDEVTLDIENGEKSMTLYAVWKPYLEPRPVREAAEEDPDADYDPDYDMPEAEFSPRALGEDGKLTAAFRELIMNGEVEFDCLASYSSEKKTEYLNEYLDDAAKKVADDFASLRTDYDYYLENEMNTLLITRLEREIGSSASVSDEEVQARFDQMVAANREAYGGNRSSYESALTDALSSAYYHEYTSADERYGFVLNILLQLPDEDLAELTQMVEDGIYSDKSAVIHERDELLRALEINVSNPDYDPDYVCDNHTCEAGSDCDPMTCPNHACKDKVNEDADWNRIVEFVYDKDTGTAEIRYNVTACPSMAYLPGTVPAFTQEGEQTGIVEQIYNSLAQVTQAVKDGMPAVLGVYWTREVATAWLYLVGDDAGGTSSDSNNGGLGYLVTPEGTDSGYIDAFTEQARALISGGGTGAYERIAGDGATENNFYVFGDNFIESGSTSGAYAGIFIIVVSDVPYDTDLKGVTTDADGNASQIDLVFGDDGILPLDYVIEYGPTLEDCVTIREQIKDTILTSRQSALYEEAVNAFGVEHYESNISYNRGAYESLWKNLD